MGLYLHTWLCLAHRCMRTARLRYLQVTLRPLLCPASSPLSPSRHTCTCSLILPPPPQTLIRKTLLKLARLKKESFGWLTADPHGNMHRRQMRCLRSQNMCSRRAYSSSRPDPPRPGPEAQGGEAPIGVLVERKANLQLGYLGERLGASFQYLSSHVNSYFKGLDTPNQPLSGVGKEGLGSGEAGLVNREVGHVHGARLMNRGAEFGIREAGSTRRGKRHQNQRLANERAGPWGGSHEWAKVQEAPAKQTEDTPPAQAGGGVPLFHISSFATRLGESYTYVAQHINSTFSNATTRETSSGMVTDRMISTRLRRRRREVRSQVGGTGRASGQQLQGAEGAGTKQDPTPVKAEDPNTWDEGYLHFARRINSYFGVKDTDAAQELSVQNPQGARFRSVTPEILARGSVRLGSPTDSTLGRKAPSPAANQEAETFWHRSPGLFHISNLATSFGESYEQMAHHVNHYFKGQGGDEDEGEGEEGGLQADWREVGYTSDPPQGRIGSFIWTAISDLLGSNSTASPSGITWRTQGVGERKLAEEKTRVLVRTLQQAASLSSLHACIEKLNEHLFRYPACTLVAWQEKAVALLLARRRFQGDVPELQDAIRETLALIGYVDSVKGRGIRILSIDGGGTRGVVPLQVLKRLEAATGRQVHQLFDYICGVSTGAVLAFMLGLMRISLEECEEMYRRFGADVFRQNPLVGTVKMGWSHSYYNTSAWEELLRKNMGDTVLIKTARDQLSPKVSAVSAVVNWGTSPKAFVFRNYNHAPGRLSRYAGASGYQLWQAIRASSAAPGYFQEFPLHSDIHQDGALILNNPCALAVHECRLLWPTRPFQCVLSLGTGRYDNTRRGPVTSTSLRSKISNLISSATDTEGVHTLLDDLLSANIYFRFNPMLNAEVSMDESRPETLDLLQTDTQLYLDRNQLKLERLCRALGPERGAMQLAEDWIRERALELRQRWA